MIVKTERKLGVLSKMLLRHRPSPIPPFSATLSNLGHEIPSQTPPSRLPPLSAPPKIPLSSLLSALSKSVEERKEEKGGGKRGTMLVNINAFIHDRPSAKLDTKKEGGKEEGRKRGNTARPKNATAAQHAAKI